MTDTAKPSDKILAHRIVRAAGVDTEKLNEAAKDALGMLRKRQRDDAEDKDAPLPDALETWMTHSGRQLQRFFGGRCISCVNWTPKHDNAGTCTALPAQLEYKTSAPTDAAFGCTLYQELPADDAATIRARTELAIALELLQPFPGEDV